MKIIFKSYIKQVEKELADHEKAIIKSCTAHLKNKISAKIDKVGPSAPGEAPGKVSGKLKKALGTKATKTFGQVGFRAEAYYAHMLEFGTVKMAPRPVLFSTFEEESSTIESIISGRWL